MTWVLPVFSRSMVQILDTSDSHDGVEGANQKVRNEKLEPIVSKTYGLVPSELSGLES